MTPAEYEDRLHACLDARRDPLDDAAICAYLAGHPDELERFATLRQRLAVLGLAALPPCAGTPARRRGPFVLAGILAAAVIAAVVLAVRAGRVDEETQRGAGRVLAADLAPLTAQQHVAATYHVRQRLAAGPTLFLETFELRSERR
jgi:hypothetical protein